MPNKEFMDLSADMVGFWKSYTIYAAVHLKIPDFLPGTVSNISIKTKVSAIKVRRLLRALWDLDIVKPKSNGTWVLTRKGQLLKPTHSSFMAAAAKMWIESNLGLWSNLVEALQRTDEIPVPYFRNLSQSPKLLNQYHRALEGYAVQDYQALVNLRCWKHSNRVLDVGCGSGSLLTQLLQRHSHLWGIFCDFPDVIDRIKLPRLLEKRTEFLKQDFFEPWSVSVDTIILSRVLHDWPDVEATAILSQAHRSLVPLGKLYIIEMILDEASPKGGLLDLNMLVATTGQERSKEDFGHLLTQAKFKIEEINGLSSVTSVMIASPL